MACPSTALTEEAEAVVNNNVAPLPEMLQAAITIFKQRHPEFAIRKNAKDNCKVASSLFCTILVSLGYDKRPGVFEVAVVGDTCHYAAYAMGYWIDWTARQFDASAPYPAVGREDTMVWDYAGGIGSH